MVHVVTTRSEKVRSINAWQTSRLEHSSSVHLAAGRNAKFMFAVLESTHLLLRSHHSKAFVIWLLPSILECPLHKEINILRGFQKSALWKCKSRYFFIIFKCAVEQHCHWWKIIYSISGKWMNEWMNVDHWWDYTDRRYLKYWEKDLS